MKPTLRLLIVEDSEFDARMMVGLLRKEGYDVTHERVETPDAMRKALLADDWNLILADYNLPEFNALAALELLKESGKDLPFIIVSGGIGEDIAVAAMKAGAHDYLMKGNLNRLGPAVSREIREAGIRTSQRDNKRALLESELRYRLLWENSPEAVLLIDPSGCIQFANPAVQTIFGYDPASIMGKNVRMLQPDHIQESRQGAFDTFLQSRPLDGAVRAVETVGLRRDQTEFPMEVSFSMMSLHGNGKDQFIGFIRDITERKKAEKELREHAEQFRVARDIQRRLFPKASPTVPGFDIAGASHPAEAAGGDYFDFLPMLKGGLGMVVGDVTGHGIGPALLMAETRAYLRVLVGRREDVGEILTRANGILAEDMGTERFITLCFLRIDQRKRTLTYASAGHPPGYILAADGRLKRTLPRTGVPLGMQPDSTYHASKEIQLESGDLILILTDGIEEAMSIEDDFFGVDRALDVVREHRDKPAKAIVEALYKAVRSFSGNAAPLDDLTALVVKVV